MATEQNDSAMWTDSTTWHEIRRFYLERAQREFSGLACEPPVNLEEFNRLVTVLQDADWRHWIHDLQLKSSPDGKPASQQNHRSFWKGPMDEVPNPVEVGLIPLEPADRISVVVPVFNEESTIMDILRQLASVPAVSQIVVVNDASRDQTNAQLLALVADQEDEFWTRRLSGGLLVFTHPINQGKGAALKTGFAQTTEPWVAIQDADTEYNPLDLMRLLHTAKVEDANIVYGSRFALNDAQASPAWHRWGNSLITRLANFCFGLDLTDVETCYKLIEGARLRPLVGQLKENRFGVEIELTAKLARGRGAKFAECPIQYDRRTYAQGKKIGVRDGFRALYCMVRYRWAD